MASKTNLHVSQHPLVLDRLGPLRDCATAPPAFRRVVRELAQMLFFEATRDLRLDSYTVTTPLAECPAQRLGERLGLVPILRAGLGMAEAIIEIVPSVQVWHLGLYRDHKTLKPITYYNKLPAQTTLDLCFVVDPMLATGNSAIAAVDRVKGAKPRSIKFVCVLTAPEGVANFHDTHPDVPIYTASIDERLDERGYIVPGIGDAGDRLFGTK